jgi:hypothetical protein
VDSVNEIAEQVSELISRSLDLGDGEEQISLREEAVRLSDLTGDLNLQYYAREIYVRACMFGGAAEKGLVAFSWLLAQFDQHPGQFDQWSILWKYKWIVNSIYDFPQIPKARIYEMLDDLAVRSQKAGYGLRAVLNLQYRIEKLFDNREKAIEYFQKMRLQPRDRLSNCPVCENDEKVSFATYSGFDERAVEMAQPLLNGDEKCATVPHRTYANLLLPLIRLGRYEEALLYHRRGYELISDNPGFLDRIPDHIILLALTENFQRGTQLVEKHYAWTEINKDLLGRFRFFRAASLLFEMWAEANDHSSTIKVNLPESFPQYSEDGHYDPLQLAGWFREQAAAIAKQFDQRNENDFYARTLAETANLKKLRTPHPLS